MTEMEANKVIAEFMGECWHDHIVQGQCQRCFKLLAGKVRVIYTRSLDSLVPVWEKLRVNFSFISKEDETPEDTRSGFYRPIEGSYRAWLREYQFSDTYSADGETIQQAAAFATAKAILEIKEQNK